MEQVLFPDLTPESREETIREMAVKVDHMIYSKPLTEEEMDFHYKEMGNTVIKKDAKQTDLKEIQEQFKNDIAPLDNKIKEHMKCIKTKSMEIEGEVFAVVDHETKMTGYYDVSGLLVSSRRALPEELQGMTVSRQLEANG